jgi:hypothetical protein
MRNLVIENDHMSQIPDILNHILTTRFTENREFWVNFKYAFLPVNEKSSIDRFKSLETGDNIIFQTTFNDWNQFELMLGLLNKLRNAGKQINVYIVHSNLGMVLDKYLVAQKPEVAHIMLLNVLRHHNIYQCGIRADNDRLFKNPLGERDISVLASEKKEANKRTVQKRSVCQGQQPLSLVPAF